MVKANGKVFRVFFFFFLFFSPPSLCLSLFLCSFCAPGSISASSYPLALVYIDLQQEYEKRKEEYKHSCHVDCVQEVHNLEELSEIFDNSDNKLVVWFRPAEFVLNSDL